jgi:hypothetical protein
MRKGMWKTWWGYMRRNWFVPLPEIDDIEAYNRELLKKSQEKAEVHYKKVKPIKELFAEDLKALLPRPTRPFTV